MLHIDLLIFKVEEEKVTFKIFEALRKLASSNDSCYMIDVLDSVVFYSFQEIIQHDALEHYIMKGDKVNTENTNFARAGGLSRG